MIKQAVHSIGICILLAAGAQAGFTIDSYSGNIEAETNLDTQSDWQYQIISDAASANSTIDLALELDPDNDNEPEVFSYASASSAAVVSDGGNTLSVWAYALAHHDMFTEEFDDLSAIERSWASVDHFRVEFAAPSDNIDYSYSAWWVLDYYDGYFEVYNVTQGVEVLRVDIDTYDNFYDSDVLALGASQGDTIRVTIDLFADDPPNGDYSGAFDASVGITFTPEPTSLMLLCIAVLPLLRRRR